MRKFAFFLLIFVIGGITGLILGVSRKSQKVESQDLALEGQIDFSGELGDNSLNLSPQKVAKNVIFLIGDGMGLTQVSAGMAVNGNRLQLERCSHTGLIKTSAANKYITDSAASGTAMSSGKKTDNGMIAMLPNGEHTETILEMAEAKGLHTGLISTSTITHATPASFIAHQKSRNSYEAIAADFLQTDVEVIIGGGMDNFTKREDGQDLVAKLQENGYTVLDNIDAVMKSDAGKLYGLCAPEHMAPVMEGRGDFLPNAVQTAISKLSKSENGFFLMAEASQIDWGGHANDAEYVVTEMLDFDKVIGEVLNFAEANGETLVVITADHETGGLTITDFDQDEKKVSMDFSSLGHTPVMVPVFAYGPGAESFSGVYENTGIFHKMVAALGLKDQVAEPVSQ